MNRYSREAIGHLNLVKDAGLGLGLEYRLEQGLTQHQHTRLSLDSAELQESDYHLI